MLGPVRRSCHGPYLRRVRRSCYGPYLGEGLKVLLMTPCYKASNIRPRCKVTGLSIADLEDAPRQRAASEEHLSLVTPLIPGVRTQSMTSGCRNMLTKRKHARSTKRCHLVGQALSLFSPSRYHYFVCVIHMMYHYLLVCQISWIYIAHMPWFLYDTKLL
jgi:hypothetical protein